MELRGSQALCILDVHALDYSDFEIEECAIRLASAIDAPEGPDEAAVAASREMARIHLLAVEGEVQRRRAVAARHAEESLPTRVDVQGALGTLVDDGRDDDATRFVRAAESLLESAAERSQPSVVCDILDASGDLPAATPSASIDPWVKAAYVLRRLVQVLDSSNADVAVQSAARMALRLLFSSTRLRSFVGRLGPDLMDVEPLHLSAVLRQAHAAAEYWHAAGYPHDDLRQYSSFPTNEERGRPLPHPQVVQANLALQRAGQTGGVSHPLRMPVDFSAHRHRATLFWERGLPPVPGDQLGMSFYSGSEAGALLRPSPDGLAVVLVLPASRILSVGAAEDAANEALLDDLRHQAARSGSPEDLHKRLRDLLIRKGYFALARRGRFAAGSGTQYILFDTSERYALILRESVPAFCATLADIIPPETSDLA